MFDGRVPESNGIWWEFTKIDIKQVVSSIMKHTWCQQVGFVPAAVWKWGMPIAQE